MKTILRLTASAIALALTLTACSCSADTPPYGINGASGINGANSAPINSDNPGGSNGTAPPPANIPNIDGLSEFADEYEGTEGTGAFNYGEALQKSLVFYELQRSGHLSGEERTNWRGDSGLSDGSDNGVDLTGGLYDAGDNVKFNLPMAYTSSMLAWSVYEDKDSYEESGQLKYILSTIRWVNDYLIKCHTADNEFYYQVGDGHADHAWWGAAEVMQMDRPSYKVTLDAPGSTVTGEAAASLAAAAVVFKSIDPEYSAKCLNHAKQLYDFAESTESDSGYTAASGFYNSWSGFYDELSWAAAWLCTATGDESYLAKAKAYFVKADTDYKWSMCWDDKGIGAALRLLQLTGENEYRAFLEKSLDYWTTGSGGERITYTPQGLAWLDAWGSLRYATAQAFIAACYSESEYCPSDKKTAYWDFAVSQVDYALGSTGRSFVCGFGENPPVHPHHRTSQGSYADNMNTPEEARHTLYGALVGGPNSSDGYTDTVSDYNANEVACDYNAGYTCALAKLYGVYKGKTLVGFGAVEPVEAEYEAEACVNAAGDNFTEIKAIVYNKTAWPARASDKLKLRYFINLSETSPEAITVNMNYSKDNAVCTIVPWDEEKGLYCAEVDFGNTLIYPGGQDAYRSEVQFRMTSSDSWDNSNDFSYAGLGSQQGTATSVSTVALYDNGKLVWGSEPDGEAGEPIQSVGPSEITSPSKPSAPSAAENDVTVRLTNSNPQSNTISLSLEISNSSGRDISLEDLEIRYYFTSDGGSPVFECYYSAVEGDGYRAQSGVKGEIEAASGENCDSVVKISGAVGVLSPNAKWTINAAVHNSDWSVLDQSNDFSCNNAEKIAVYSNGSRICGKTPS